MTKFLIRNDDIGFDTEIGEITRFCEICDKYGYKIIQGITPVGLSGRQARSTMNNEEIKLLSFKRFEENQEVLKFLLSRNDFIGVHGLWHTHSPTFEEIKKSKEILEQLGFKPTYFIPPFNEGNYEPEILGLKLSQLSQENGDRLEDYLHTGTPTAPVVYLHSWRFNHVKYKWKHLEQCLARLSEVSKFRLWYNDWVKQNAQGNVLDVGKSRYWEYGFPTIDTDNRLSPTYIGTIEQTDFADGSFDTVLCNGMYEFVESPQKMINEVLRITKPNGTIIFGFVGRDYKPYKKPWRFFDNKETLPPHERIDFGSEYHFLICKKQ